MIIEVIFDNDSAVEDNVKSCESALSEFTETGSASGRPRVSGSLTEEPPVGGATREFATSTCCTPSADTRVICRETETTAQLSPVLEPGAQRSDALTAEAMARAPWAVSPLGGTTVVIAVALHCKSTNTTSGMRAVDPLTFRCTTCEVRVLTRSLADLMRRLGPI